MLLADADDLSRDSLRDVLAGAGDLRVVGEADSGAAAVGLARELEPQVVTVDVVMTELNGVEATRRIVEELPEVAALAVSVHDERQYVRAMVAAGARGYVQKEHVGEAGGSGADGGGGGRFFGEGVGGFLQSSGPKHETE